MKLQIYFQIHWTDGKEEPVQSHETWTGCGCLCIISWEFLSVLSELDMNPMCQHHKAVFLLKWKVFLFQNGLKLSFSAGPGHANVVLLTESNILKNAQLREQRSRKLKLDDAVTALIFYLFLIYLLLFNPHLQKRGLWDMQLWKWSHKLYWLTVGKHALKVLICLPKACFLLNEMNEPENKMLGGRKAREMLNMELETVLHGVFIFIFMKYVKWLHMPRKVPHTCLFWACNAD